MNRFQTEALRRALEALGSLVVTNNMAIPSAERFREQIAIQALGLNDQQFAVLLKLYQDAAAATFLAYNIMKRRELGEPEATPQFQMQELSLAIAELESDQE